MLILSKIVVVVVVVVVALATATVATKPSHSTNKEEEDPQQEPRRRSGHDPVLIVVVIIIIIVCKTNVVGRDSATIASASFLTHTCQWSFIAMVGVVVAVAFGEFVIVADSVVSLSSFC